MTRRTRVIAGVTGVILVALAAAAFFLRYQLRKSFPVTAGTLRVAGIQQPVVVRRDPYGVPRIEAENEHDLMMAVGVVHAQDRLWQMDLQRRAGEGRLSELFGIATLPYDRMFRVVGIRRSAEAIAGTMDPASLQRLQWYADGVNAFIEGNRGRLPVEFDLLRYRPEPWTPVQSIMIGRLMAWELNLAWWTDVTYGLIADRVGPMAALEIMPDFPPDVAPAVPSAEWRSYATLAGSYMHTAMAYGETFSSSSINGGSNAWVVAPRRSTTGAVLLANDTHLRLESPSRWYELQMVAPGVNVRGMSIAGVPAVIAGRNARIAWGLTNVMADDADFYAEMLDSVSGTSYFYDGQWKPVRTLSEEITVRGDSVHPITIRLTHHGPLISDLDVPEHHANPAYAVSMRWTGNEIDDQFGAMTRIDRARNWKEFIAGVREFAVPGQNFVYGDSDGTIGYWCGAKIPIRGGRGSLLPLPGWDPGAEWRGYVPFARLPHRLDPPEGFIASANNKLVDDAYPYHISDLWEPASRIQRLYAVLGRKEDVFSVQDFEWLQNDTYSYYAREVVPYLMSACGDSAAGFPGGEHVYEYFHNWNFQFGRDDLATTIFHVFLERLIRNIFADEMGDDLLHDWMTLSNIPLRVTLRLLREENSAWFDDITTTRKETRDEILRKSLREALHELEQRCGTDTRNWRWGDLHSVELRHPFGNRKPLDRIFNLGPYPVSGGPTALVSCEYSLNEPFQVDVGPSFRQIFDMAGDGGIRSVITSGQSGQAFHRHYDDQTRLWLNGGYRVSTFAGARQGDQEHLVLEPVQ
jgi:penicillin amidase